MKNIRTLVLNELEACIPFLILGMLGCKLAFVFAIWIIVLACLTLVSYFVAHKNMDSNIMSLNLQIYNDSLAAYIFLLSSLIVISHGLEAMSGVWFSLIVWAMIVGNAIIDIYKIKKK